MGTIDGIQGIFGSGDGERFRATPIKKESSTDIDTTDKVSFSRPPSGEEVGAIFAVGRVPSKDISAETKLEDTSSGKGDSISQFKVASAPSNIPVNISQIEDDPKTKSMEDFEKKLKETVHRMTAIARATGGDFRMELHEGANWAYHFETNSITYPPADLIEKSPEYALGVILHEGSHRRYSKWFVEPEFQQKEPFLFLNNAVEDPRVNNITISRYAGAKDYFKKVYDEDLFTPEFNSGIKKKMIDEMVRAGLAKEQAEKAAEQFAGGTIPRHIQFGLAMIYDWYTDGKMDPRVHDPIVKKALEEAAPYYREAFGLKREVLTKDLTPDEINQQAKECYEIVRDKLWPIYEKLVEEDKKDLSNQIQKQGQSGKSSQSGQSSGNESGSTSKSSESRDGKDSGSTNKSSGSSSGKESGSSSDKQGDDKKGGGQGSGEIDPQKAKEIAEKVIDSIDKELSGNKFEERDKKARRENRSGGNQSGKVGKGQGSMEPNKGKDLKDGKDAGDGKDSKDGRDSTDGKDVGDTGKDGKGVDGDKAGDQGNEADGAQSQNNQGQNDQQEQGSSGGSTSDIDLPSIEELLQKKLEIEARNEAMQSPYDKYVYDTVEFSEQLAGEMKNFIHEHERPRYVGNFSTGKKINLRKAMQSEAKFQLTGEFDDEIWLRREHPTKRDHQFIFVMDESGSMREQEKWTNALKGLVLCQEALYELDIDFGVIGFSDNPQVHKTLEDKFDENFRNNEFAQIMSSPAGGTNDADAVKIALEMLRSQDADKMKTIIVITDGEGKKEEMKKLIAEAEEAGIKIIGVGIGAGTQTVEEVYPTHVKVDRIAQLPGKLSDIIRTQVEDSYGG